MIFRKFNSLFIGHFQALFSEESLVHGFSTRFGGVSPSPFDSLNLGVNTEDKIRNIQLNQNRFLNALDIPKSRLAIPRQIHNDRVEYVETPGRVFESDALITNRTEIALSIQVADCVPIFLYEPSVPCIGLIHAGWKGTALNISKNTVLAMSRHFHADPGLIQAFIGPSIGPCCYHVGPEVLNHFTSVTADSCLDLWQVNISQMQSAGIQPDHIESSGICTRCNSGFFFSYRASRGVTGRMMAVIMLRKQD